MALRVFATLALLTLGVCVGLVATMIDIYAVGGPAFIEHVTLWVFLNALLASHVENKTYVMLWSIPMNLGFFLSYYIATSATYEGYPRSLVVPLSAMALLAPLLAYGLWYVKDNRGIYGKILALLAGAATAGMNYLIAGEVSVYAGVMAALTFVLLAIIPTRRLRLTPIEHPDTELSAEDGLAQDLVRRKAEKRGARRAGTTGRRAVSREEYDEIGPLERPVSAADILDTGARELGEASRAARPTRRKASGVRRSTSRSRRNQLRDYERERAERRMAASERRARDGADAQDAPRPSTLGNARAATRSRRGY